MNLKAREAVKLYHQKLYVKHKLFKKGSWLEKPEQEIQQLGKQFVHHDDINILDLGCGVGRNSIPLAQILYKNHPHIICVDYLEVAIQKLHFYAKQYGVEQCITTQLSEVERYEIKNNYFDLIIAHGILAYLENEKKLKEVLQNIIQGTNIKGFNYLSINADIEEQYVISKKEIKPLIEINLTSDKVISLLKNFYRDWKIVMLKKNPYKEIYEKDGKTIRYDCNFVVFIAQKI